MSRLVDLNITRLVWISSATLTAYPTLSAATLNAANYLSPYVLPDYTLMADTSDSVNEKSITDTATSEVPTIGKYKATLHVFRDYTTAAVPSAVDPLTIFQGNYEDGYLIRRVGKPASSVIVSGDIVEAYRFKADVPQIAAGTGSGFVKVTIPFFPQGAFNIAITCVS